MYFPGQHLSFIYSNKPVKQITQHKATPSTSKIDICIADVSGNCIQGSVRIGKKVMVKAILLSKLLSSRIVCGETINVGDCFIFQGSDDQWDQ